MGTGGQLAILLKNMLVVQGFCVLILSGLSSTGEETELPSLPEAVRLLQLDTVIHLRQTNKEQENIISAKDSQIAKLEVRNAGKDETITVEVTPNRKFEGIFGWDFQTLSTGNFHFDVKGENPWVGNYAIDRHANWEMNKPRYMFNWVGKSEFKTGPFSSFSPIDTKMNFVFNTRKMVLNADMVETMGGKQWGLKIHKNRFSVLTGNAA